MMKLVTGLSCIMLLCWGCKKHVESGITVRVSGHIQDTMRNQAIAGLKLYAVEYDKNCFLCRPLPRANIDSGYTDAAGNYSINFTTTGRGTNYRIRVSDEFINDYWGFLESGFLNMKDTTIDFQTFRFSNLNQHITMANIPKPPLFVFSSPAYRDERIYNFPADTIIQMKVIPKRENYIYYKYNDTRGFSNMKIDTFFVSSLQDEYEMDVVLDTAAFKPEF